MSNSRLQEGDLICYTIVPSYLCRRADSVNIWKEGTDEKYTTYFAGKTNFEQSQLVAHDGEFLLMEDNVLFQEYSYLNKRLSNWNIHDRIIYISNFPSDFSLIINLDCREVTQGRPLTYNKERVCENTPWLYLGEVNQMKFLSGTTKSAAIMNWKPLNSNDKIDESFDIFIIDLAKYNCQYNILGLPQEILENLDGYAFAIAFNSERNEAIFVLRNS